MTAGIPRERRAALAATLLSRRLDVPAAVVDELFARDPGRTAAWGDRAREQRLEEAASHIDFLAAATEAGAVSSFAEFVRWRCRTLAARGVSPDVVEECLAAIGARLLPALEGPEAEWVRSLLAAGRLAAGEGVSAPSKDPGGEFATERRIFLRALLAGQRRSALNVALGAVKRGRAVQDVYAEILQESLYEVGRLWESNSITVATEHMATHIVQHVVAQLCPLLPRPTVARGRVVLTGVEGEMHELGPTMISDVLESDGWEVFFLGTNTPGPGILQAIEAHAPEILGISCTMLVSVARVRTLIRQIRDRFGPRNPRILVGGAVFRLLPDLAEELGANGWARDIRDVALVARRLAEA